MTRYYVKAVWDGVVEVDDNGFGPDAAIAAARDWLMDGLDLSDLARGSVATAVDPDEYETEDRITVSAWKPEYGMASYEFPEEDDPDVIVQDEMLKRGQSVLGPR